VLEWTGYCKSHDFGTIFGLLSAVRGCRLSAEGGKIDMNALEIILTILEVIASVALIAVVLLQSGKNSGLGTISGNNENYMSKGKANGIDKMLANSTKWIAAAWLVLTLSLSLI